MHPNEQLIQTFYKAFHQRDYQTMNQSYQEDIQFYDPVFLNLKGPQVKAMWQMLCARAQDLEITCKDITADDHRGSCHWEAKYTFQATGRPVHNIVKTTFEFKAGKISRHTDKFDLWKWTKMALGMKGTLLGWLPSVQNRIRVTASKGLKVFMEKTPEYSS